jgi:hypothetical protein
VKFKIFSPLVLLLGLSLSGMAAAAGPVAPAAPGRVYSSESASGSIELSNISADESQEPVATAPAAANTDNSAAAAPGAEPVAADEPKDPREQYRDKVLQAPDVATPATTNASRRYKMMDLATYRANVLGNTAPAPQGGASAPQ